MNPQEKPVRFSGHARGRLAARGTTEEEVTEAIRTAAWRPALEGRLECDKEFPFNADWNGNFYATKRVRPIFVERAERIVVVTAYVYYF